MKPNDKAIEAARAEGKRWQEGLNRPENQIPCWKVLREADDGYDVIAKFNSREERDKALERLRAEAMVNAAFAAQFQSDDYAGLVKELRSPAMIFYEYSADKGSMIRKAADALEALLAERDDWKTGCYFAANERDQAQEYADKVGEENDALKAERDALLARLAPVEDEALVEIVAKAIETQVPPQDVQMGDLWDAAIAAIAAIRPHIEAAERERVLREIRENNQAIRKLANDWGMEIKIEQIRSGK